MWVGMQAMYYLGTRETHSETKETDRENCTNPDLRIMLA